jgi:autotransporter-associated beta strand protein
MVAAALLGVGVSQAPQAKAANLYWDANGTTPGVGGTGSWDTTSAFWSSSSAGTDAAATANFTANDIAYFTGTTGEVTLSGATTIGGLVFTGADFSITGSTLTLAAPTGSATPAVSVSAGNRATVTSVVAGTSGLTKTGNGSLLLTNTGNSFTGDVTIKGGSLVVTSNAQLGLGTGQVSIFGWANSGNPGYSGGSLVVKGATAAGAQGITIARDITFSGRGPTAVNNSGGLISIGYNTFSGTIGFGSAATEARAWSAYGSTNLSGNVYLGGTGQGTVFQGNGNWIISGRVGGSEISNDRFIKSQQLISTLLWLQNGANTFTQTVRIDGGNVRVNAAGALGLAVSNQSFSQQNGTFEVRSDDLAGFASRGITQYNNSTGYLIVDHDTTGALGLGGAGINQTLALAVLNTPVANTNTLSFVTAGRNGFGVTYASLTGSGDGSVTLYNHGSGLETLAGSITAINSTSARTLTFGGNLSSNTGSGDIILTGSFTPSGAARHQLQKVGPGLLTIQGNASTFTGDTIIANDRGAISISDIGALNAATGRVLFTGNVATLIYTGAGQTWSNKVLDLNSSNGALLNNGTGALVLAQNIAVNNNGTNARTLVLGGNNSGTNELQGLITSGSASTGLRKVGSGSWQLTAPASGATVWGTPASAFGITATGTSATSIITTASTAGLAIGQPVGGYNISAGTVISQIISATQFAISASITASGTKVSLGSAAGSNAAISTVAASGGTTTAPTLTVAYVPSVVAGLVVGQGVTHASLPASQGWFLNGLSTSTVSATTTAVSGGTSTAPILTMPTAGLVVGQPVTSGTAIPSAGAWYIKTIDSATQVTLNSDNGATITVGAVASGASISATTLVLTLANNTSSSLTVGTIASGQSVAPGLTPNYSGTTQISDGSLSVKATAASSDVLNNFSGVSFITDPIFGTHLAGGVFNYLAYSGGSSEAVGVLTPSAGAGRVIVTPGSSGASTLTFASLGARSAGATLAFSYGVGTGTAGIQFMAAPAGSNGIIGGFATITDPATGAVDFVATPTASTNITALASAVALPAVTGAASGNYVATTAITTTGAVAANTLRIAGGGVVLGGTLSITSTGATTLGGILHDNAGGAATISGNFGITTSASNNELVIITAGSTPANALTISANLTNGTGTLTKAGNGLLVLSGTNTFTGSTTINEGTLRLGSAGALAVSPAAGSVLSIRQLGTLDLAVAGASSAPYVGGTATPTIILPPVNASGSITNSISGPLVVQLGVAASTGNAIISSVIADGAGVLSLNVRTTATQALSALNTYTGATVLTAGTLQVNSLANGGVASSIGASTSAAANLVFNGGTLTYTGASSLFHQYTQTPSVSIDREFTLAGSGVIQSSGKYGSSYNSAATDNNATLVFASTADVSFAGTGTRSLTLGGTSIGDNRIRIRLKDNPNAAEALSLTKADAGLWVLDPLTSNTYTGATTISGGSLRAIVTGAVVGVPTNSPITLNGGVLEVGGVTFTRAVAGSVAGTGTVSFAGAAGFSAGTTSRLVVSLAVGATPNADLTWGTTAGFNPSSLVLGSSTALGEAEITNNINLGTAARTITVNNNGNTGTMVTAGILSGVISGGAGGTITKSGGGVLILGNANTYVGDTTVTAGNVIVTSIGNASGTASSSLGASGGKVIYNPGDSDLAGIFYVGPGETASRPWTMSASGNHGSTTRIYRIDASGSGALILTGGFTNTTPAGAASRFLNLELRGASAEFNQMNMVLTDSTGTNTPKLNVTKNDGGVWVLNPSSPNLFTGSITSSGGLLGLTTNGLGAASGITVSNGGIFAYGGALSTAKVLTLGNNATTVITGANSMTFTGGVTMASGDNSITLSNNLEAGATLTVASNLTNSKTSSQTLNFRGTGTTVWNGILANPGGAFTTSISVQLAPNASLTLSGAANTNTGKTTMSQGRLILSKTLGTTSTLDFNGGTIEGTLDLTGANALSHQVWLGGDPATFTGAFNIELSNATNALYWGASRTLVNDLSAGKTLTVSGGVTNTAAATLTITGGGATVISGVIAAGTVATSLTFAGNSTLVLTAANVTTGALTVNRSTVTFPGPTVHGRGRERLSRSTPAARWSSTTPRIITTDCLTPEPSTSWAAR